MKSVRKNHRKTYFSSTEMRIIPESPQDRMGCHWRNKFPMGIYKQRPGRKNTTMRLISGLNYFSGLFHNPSSHQILIHNSWITLMINSCHSSLKFQGNLFINKNTCR